MKKAIFVLAILCYALHSQAAASFKADTVKTDSVKFNKKVAKLKVDLTDLTSELTKVQNQIPVDSAKAAEVAKTQKKLDDLMKKPE